MTTRQVLQMMVLMSAPLLSHAYISMSEANSPPTSFDTDPQATTNTYSTQPIITEPQTPVLPGLNTKQPPKPTPNANPTAYAPPTESTDDASKDPDPERDTQPSPDTGAIPTESS